MFHNFIPTMNSTKKVCLPQDDALERILFSSFGIPVYMNLMTPEEIERARTYYYVRRDQTIQLDRHKTPDEGFEPSTTRLKVWRSTD